MNKIIYTLDDKLYIVTPMSKEAIERDLITSMTEEQYRAHVYERSIPENAMNVREIDDVDMPINREWRNAWTDVTPLSCIDIDCSKAKEIALNRIREKREELFKPLDQEFMIALEKGLDTSEIKAKKQALRDLTIPIKAINTENMINNQAVLQTLSELSDI